MGVLETTARRRRRVGALQRGILIAVAVGGMAIIGGVPHPGQLLKFFSNRKENARFRERSKTAFKRLVSGGLIRFEEVGERRVPRLTQKGQLVLALEQGRSPDSRRPKKWDRRWRIVVFDIAEKRKSVREKLRRFMVQYGFVRLQDSVWVYPYDCEDLITLVKADFRIGSGVLYIIAESVEHDRYLREHFDLPTA